jgi:hypothetical protein
MEHPKYSPDWAADAFLLFPEMNPVLNGQRFQYIEDIQKTKKKEKKSVDSSESYSTTRVPKTFP